MAKMRVSTNPALRGIYLLIYNTLHKVIQQVHATGPLVSHMDFFWPSPYQYMRDKDTSSFVFLFEFTVHAVHDLFEQMLHVLRSFMSELVLFLIISVRRAVFQLDRSEWKT